MRSLYEINQDYLNALESAFEVDEETGEVIFEPAMLDLLNKEFESKVDNIVCFIKDLEVLSEGIKAEKKALDERLKYNDTRIDRLKNYVAESLKMRQMDKMETPRNKLSFRTSKSVEVIDERLISDTYWRTVTEKKLDKKMILDQLKSGIEVEGCKLLEKSNLQVK